MTRARGEQPRVSRFTVGKRDEAIEAMGEALAEMVRRTKEARTPQQAARVERIKAIRRAEHEGRLSSVEADRQVQEVHEADRPV